MHGGEEAAGGRRSPRARIRRIGACTAGKRLPEGGEAREGEPEGFELARRARKLLEGGEAREGEPEGFELARRGRKLLEGFPRVL